MPNLEYTNTGHFRSCSSWVSKICTIFLIIKEAYLFGSIQARSQKFSREYWLEVVQVGGTMQGGGGIIYRKLPFSSVELLLVCIYQFSRAEQPPPPCTAPPPHTISIQFSMALYRETGPGQNQIVILSNAIKHCTYLAIKVLCNND